MEYLGIDPDIKKSGLFLYEEKSKKFLVFNLDFFDTLKKIKEVGENEGLIVIEKGELNKFLFVAQKQKNKSVALKIASNTGKNFAVSDLLIEYCKKNSFKYEIFTPKTFKIKSKMFEQLTGVKRSNQEIRDAFRCVLKYYK